MMVKPELKDKWLQLYKDIDWIQMQLLKADAWLLANPTRQKKQMARFYNNWLSRAFEYNPPPIKKIIQKMPEPDLENCVDPREVKSLISSVLKNIKSV